MQLIVDSGQSPYSITHFDVYENEHGRYFRILIQLDGNTVCLLPGG